MYRTMVHPMPGMKFKESWEVNICEAHRTQLELEAGMRSLRNVM